MNPAFNDLQSRVLLSKRAAGSFTHYLTMKQESLRTFLSAHDILPRTTSLLSSCAPSFPSAHVAGGNQEAGAMTVPPNRSQEHRALPTAELMQVEKQFASQSHQ